MRSSEELSYVVKEETTVPQVGWYRQRRRTGIGVF